MEVHHHAHTPGKKWTHYLWEFLMLFFAVFCGFLAENQREHLIEYHREKQYMRSLLEDLRTDSATMAGVYNMALVQVGALDSLIELGNQAPLKKEDISNFYLLKGRTTRFLNIHFEDGTSTQLKNAGGLRLIRNYEVVSLIRKYWDHIEVLYRVRDRLEMAGENISEVSSKIFNYKYFIEGKEPLDPPLGIKPGAELINSDKALIAEYVNKVASKLLRTRVYISELAIAMESVGRLISSIEKNYHLE